MALAIPQERPVYRILDPAGFFGPDDVLYPENAIIALDDEPNEQMEPLNDLARDAMKRLIEKLDEHARIAAQKAGRPFIARATNFDDAVAQLRADARRVELVKGDGGVPLQGAKKRGRPRIHRVDVAETAETGRAPAPIGRLSVAS